jgi:hypothetical protein
LAIGDNHAFGDNPTEAKLRKLRAVPSARSHEVIADVG